MSAHYIINRSDNKITAKGNFGMQEIHPFLATCFEATFKKGYQDLVFDFSDMESALPGFMISVCSKVIYLKTEKIDVDLILPKKLFLQKLFINTNWANLINPEKYEISTFKGSQHVPTIRFETDHEQNTAVNKILNAILSSIRSIKRKDLSAVEWSLNEITDNVLIHSESKIGGLIQLSSFNNRRKRIEFVVCDCGIGIPGSLKSTLGVNTDLEVLDKAIQEGITNGKGAGNGLFGSYQTCTRSGGYFHLHSGNASLYFNPKPKIGFRVKNETIPFNGTLLVGCLDYSIPGLLENALIFKGQKYEATDFIELLYEDPDEDSIMFVLVDESEAFGTRPAGVPIRTKILNLLELNQYKLTIKVDFNNAPLLSSSFADEVFGKLFIEIGEEKYKSLIRFLNCNKTNKIIIERSLKQRIKKIEN